MVENKMKIKIFVAETTVERLESEINDFIKDKKVINIFYDPNRNPMVLYEEIEEKEYRSEAFPNMKLTEKSKERLRMKHESQGIL